MCEIPILVLHRNRPTVKVYKNKCHHGNHACTNDLIGSTFFNASSNWNLLFTSPSINSSCSLFNSNETKPHPLTSTSHMTSYHSNSLVSLFPILTASFIGVHPCSFFSLTLGLCSRRNRVMSGVMNIIN